MTLRRRYLAALLACWTLLGVGCGTAATSDIWSVGDRWKVTVTQDSGIADPSGKSRTYKQVYRFTVAQAPEQRGDSWKVRATLDDAAGPFARGFTLYYRERGSKLVLHQVALGDSDPVPASAAPVVLGQSFPLDQTISRKPVNRSQVAASGGSGNAGMPGPSPSETPEADRPGEGTAGPAEGTDGPNGSMPPRDSPVTPPAAPPGN